MNADSGESFIRFVKISIVGCIAASLVWAVIIRAAAQWSAGIDAPFGTAYSIAITVCFAAFMVELLFLLIAESRGQAQTPVMIRAITSAVLQFLILSGASALSLQRSFGTGVRIALLTVLIGAGTGLAIGGVVMAVASLTGSAWTWI